MNIFLGIVEDGLWDNSGEVGERFRRQVRRCAQELADVSGGRVKILSSCAEELDSLVPPREARG